MAAAAYKEALKLEPGRVRSLNNLAALLMQQGDLLKAATLLAEADQQPTVDPEENALLLNTRCQLQLRLHHPHEAAILARQRAQLAPDATSWANLALALSDNNQAAAAERCQRLALGLKSNEDPRRLLWCSTGSPAACKQRHQLMQNLAVQQLRRDPWKLAHWQLLEARLGLLPGAWLSDTQNHSPFQQLWRGETVDTLLVWDEQGYGDAMQCLRWLPLLIPRCQQLTLMMRPSLISLVKHWLSENVADPNVDIQPLDQKNTLPWQHQIPHCPLMSLPVALGLDGEVALCANYSLKKEENSVLPKQGRIGIVWAAGHKPEADARTRSEQRSLPPEKLVSVLNEQLGNRWKEGEIKIVNLQQDRDVPNHPLLQKHIGKAETTNSWQETEQKISQLDGLICVDTAIAHLAGQTRLPTVVVLNTPCDWRWGTSGDRTPWYSNIVLLRHKWHPIIGNS